MMNRLARPASFAVALLLATSLVMACGEKKEEGEVEAAEPAAPAMTSAADSSTMTSQQEADSAKAWAAEAKVDEATARATALAAVPGGTFDKGELEREGGALIYSFDIKVAGKEGVQEVHVDAITAKLLSNEHESAAGEAGEEG